MRKGWLTATVIAAIFGMVIAGISIGEYLDIQKEGLEKASFCSVNEVINCDIINASSYANLLGIPTAGWGLFFYITIFFVAFYVRIRKEPKEIPLGFAWLITAVGFLWTLRMAYISAFILHAVCLTCIAQYILNLFILIALYTASKMTFKERMTQLISKKVIPTAVTTSIIFGIGYVFTLSAVKNVRAGTDAEDVVGAVDAFFRQSIYDLKPEDYAKAPIWGNKNADLTVVLFSDFQCPFCRIAAFNIKPYLHEFRDKVKFVFVNYPLDNTCNQYMERPMHSNACIAAKAALCADEKGKFWKYHDDVFKNQQKISRDVLVKLAENNGIAKEWFSQCIDSEETANRLKNDIEVGHRVFITGTPSIFINQRQLLTWRSPDVLRNVIRKSLEGPNN